MAVDELEALKRAVYTKVTASEILTGGQIQLENEKAPNSLPYCRIAVLGSGEWVYDSQKMMSKNVIVEFDFFTKIIGDVRGIRGMAAGIEELFGKYTREAAVFDLGDCSATVTQFGRGPDETESDAGLYKIAVLVYFKLARQDGLSGNANTQTNTDQHGQTLTSAGTGAETDAGANGQD